MGRRDLFWAAALGAIALAIYVRTLAPGVVAEVDTPMFQFIGRVLGVPHNPGYPLYVLITHVVAMLPFGSLAWRINLFSAVMGAVAVALTFLVARRLDCSRAASAVAAMGLAFGHVFWSQAVIAEVYTMHAALIAGALLGLLAWARSGRTVGYYAGIAVLAVGLAHHTTIVAVIAAAALFVPLVDRHFAANPRQLLTTLLMFACGLLPYAFILIRSRQPGVYLESKATNLRELLDVLLARQFAERVLAFDVASVFADRVPAVMSMLMAELTLPGIILGAIGAILLARRRLADATLLVVSAAAVVVFAINYSVVDTAVFLIPSFLVLWLLAAVTLNAVADRQPTRFRRALVGVASLALPAWLLVHGFAGANRSGDTATAVALARTFDVLPGRASVVREDFLADRLIMFEQLGDEAAAAREIDPTPREIAEVRQRLRDGVAVHAMAKSARWLRLHGFDVGFRPLPLPAGSFDDLLDSVADGSTVAVAVPAAMKAPFLSNLTLRRIGGPNVVSRATRSSLAAYGTRGAGSGAVIRDDGAENQVDAERAIVVHAGPDEASIQQGGRDLIRTGDGVAVAIWQPDGRLSHALVLKAVDGFSAQLAAGPLSLFPVKEATAMEVGPDQWALVTDLASHGALVVRAPPHSTVALYLADDEPPAPRGVDRTGQGVVVEVEQFDSANRARLADRLEQDGVPADAAEAPFVCRVIVRNGDGESGATLMGLGGVPQRAIARVLAGGAGVHATAVAVNTSGLLRVPDREWEVLSMARDEQELLIGAGWSRVKADAGGAYRSMTAREARVLMPLQRAEARRIRVQARRTHRLSDVSLRVIVNRHASESRPLHDGWGTYEWTLPPGAVTSGNVEVTVVQESSIPDIAIASISVAR